MHFDKDRKKNLLILLLLLGAVIVFLARVNLSLIPANLNQQLTPQNLALFQLDMNVDARAEEISIHTWLPKNNDDQVILDEKITSSGLTLSESDNEGGRQVTWRGNASSVQLLYKASLSIQRSTFQIDPDSKIDAVDSEIYSDYLKATPNIQVNDPEIKRLWETIKPSESDSVLPVLRAIYKYTADNLDVVPFKGTTDALTALRLGQASCNGKSRLFVALSRLNGIPARLVGGVILTPNRKKTSHQWVEVYIQGHWVPFGPTNHHFATKPDNYLVLYYGDKSLFKRTSDIYFDYGFTSIQRKVSAAVYQAILNQSGISDTAETERKKNSGLNLIDLLFKTGMNENTSALFLLFPLCTLIIGFLRNMVGIKTFGVFLPMLIAAACLYTGLWQGILAFVAILALSFVVHLALSPLHLLKISRLATIITINTLVFVSVLLLFQGVNKLEFGMLSLFPVVIISFVAERIHRLTDDHDWMQLCLIAMGTLISIIICYVVLSSFLMISLFAYYPELYLLVVAGQIYVGRWIGIRISELLRFKRLLNKEPSQVMGINSRNLQFVDALNEREYLLLAANKLESKNVLVDHHVSVPRTLSQYEEYSDLINLEKDLAGLKSFALKPNFGSQGNGILIIVDYHSGDFISAGGRHYSIDAIRQHCTSIINGQFSQAGDKDIAYIEPLIAQHKDLHSISPFGLSDIRIILIKSRPVSAMLRVPTKESDGKANLHQGAVGVAVNIVRGETYHATQQGHYVDKHPDTQRQLIGMKIPFWSDILEMCIQASKAIPLGYLGVDVCIDEKMGPMILEVNGRPGIEIQNVQDRGLYLELNRGLHL